MVKLNRQDNGKFAQKSEEYRHVRSVRLTDKTWDILGKLAEDRGITRADLIEEWVPNAIAQNLEIEVLQSKIVELQRENSLLLDSIPL